MKFFEELSALIKKLESRPTDKIMMDLSVTTKKVIYQKLLSQAERLSLLLKDS